MHETRSIKTVKKEARTSQTEVTLKLVKRSNSIEKSNMSRYIVALVLFAALVAPALSIHKVCVSWRDATDSCTENEAMALCGRSCEPTCKSMENANVPVIERCPDDVQCSSATAACSCQPGFVRNDQGKCVAPADCQQ